jgi:hypothetical protein
MNTDILYIMAGYVILFAVVIIGLNWMMKGFVLKYLQARGSRGKKQLILIRSMTDSYWGVGQLDKDPAREGAFTYKNRTKVQKVLTNIVDTDFTPLMGVFFAEVDDAKDMIIRRFRGFVPQEWVGKELSFKGDVPSCSSTLTDQFIDRAMKLPQKQAKTIMLLIGLIVLTMLIACIAVYVGIKNGTAITEVGGQVHNISISMRTIL